MDVRWLLVALLTLALWGVWGVITRVASTTLGWRETTAIAAIGHMATAIIFIVLSRPSLAPQGLPYIFAMLAGALGFAGAFTFYVALNLNPSSVVVVVTSLYPLVTMFLAFILLGETLSTRQLVGAALAIIALVLISAD
jgi:transporter family protein